MKVCRACLIWGVGLAGLIAAPFALAQRLPGNVKPEHYALRLSPDIAGKSFRGSETLDVVLATPSATITLNAAELTIDSVKAGGQTATVSFDNAKEQATFTFGRPLPAGAARLEIEYAGVLNEKLRGFYLSKSKTRSYAVTQFESTDARRAFPCFDEPALKATFDVALTIDAGDTAISNTNIVADTPAGGGKHTLQFATTPRMSTYLVAFLVGDFACSKGAADGVPIRVCSTPDKVKLTPFALAAAEHFLTYYDRYFGIKYPMPKLDLIGIPDFEAGAMENFGAITYRETELLVDEKDGPTGLKKRVSTVVAHEMAHQWFGDMVTMQWWDNLWLNEGFATWMENKAADEWHPEWHFGQDTANDLDETLNLDAARTTRAIRATADTPAQIQEMFDGISYGKAGAVIGMVENFVGAEVFRRGVHAYLAAHLYGNATAEDFWGAQTVASHQPVDRIMSSFIDKPGVPLLTFADRQDVGYPVKQRRFFVGAHGTDVVAANDVAPGWVIPVCVKTSGGPVCKLLQGDTAALEMKAAEPFFYANAADKGYYRVAYSPAQVKAITAAAETGLTVPERIGFLGDRWALTLAGQGGVGDYLDLALALKDDSNPYVLDSALTSIGAIRNKIATDEDRARLDAVVRSAFGPVWAQYAKPEKNANFERQQIRSELFHELGLAEDPAVLNEARAITTELLTGKKVEDQDLADAAVALAATGGTEEFYNRILTVSQKADDPGLQSEALETLAYFRDPTLERRTLEYAVSGQVRNQDSWVLIAIELSRAETRDLAWDWVRSHWKQVEAQLTTASGGNLISATGTFCSVGRRDEVQSFFAAHPVEASQRALAKALDGINDCVRLRALQEPNLKEWLDRQSR
jgi:aminopeptidase N/puromycin-sensitive aminopeptidase